MGFFTKVLLAVVVISAVVVFFTSYHPTGAPAAVVLAPSVSATAATPSIQMTATSSIAVPANSTFNNTDAYVDLEGTALMDDSEGLPAVPFIQFVTSAHTVMTKQLIFANSRGCSPNAGDLPCVPSYNTESAYPKLTTGERIHVQGYVRADRLLVYEITPV